MPGGDDTPEPMRLRGPCSAWLYEEGTFQKPAPGETSEHVDSLAKSWGLAVPARLSADLLQRQLLRRKGLHVGCICGSEGPGQGPSHRARGQGLTSPLPQGLPGEPPGRASSSGSLPCRQTLPRPGNPGPSDGCPDSTV